MCIIWYYFHIDRGVELLSEAVLIDVVVSKMANCGFRVYKNIVVNGVEIDVLGLEYLESSPRPLVYVVEVKSRPKPKTYKQLMKRMMFTDYLYIAIPYQYYTWALTRLDREIGIMVILDSDVRILRFAKYLGRGSKILEYLNTKLIT